MLADKFENKSLMAKSYICILSSITAFPLTALCCMIRGNFWVSMAAITMKTILSSTFTSPAMTMMQNTTRSKDQGNIISAHMFYQTIASTACPIMFSLLSTYLGAASNPGVYGTMITIFSCLGYWGSIPFWYLAGRAYKKHMEEK